jgi:hypothetical protein
MAEALVERSEAITRFKAVHEPASVHAPEARYGHIHATVRYSLSLSASDVHSKI